MLFVTGHFGTCVELSVGNISTGT